MVLEEREKKREKERWGWGERDLKYQSLSGQEMKDESKWWLISEYGFEGRKLKIYLLTR